MRLVVGPSVSRALAPLARHRVARTIEHVPSVSIRSSQQFSSSTEMLHVLPVLSCAEADVAVVMMDAARDDSTGGCSILKVLGLAPGWILWVGRTRFRGLWVAVSKRLAAWTGLRWRETAWH